MPQIIFSPSALKDLEQLRAFLHSKNAAAAKRAATVIIQTIKALNNHPEIGIPTSNPDERELLIGFGRNGYMALYRYDGSTVIILAIKHSREAGY
jgi:addiction module RelE/StbE family toxin